MKIRAANSNDLDAIVSLYRRVSRHVGGLAGLEQEIDVDYVGAFL